METWATRRQVQGPLEGKRGSQRICPHGQRLEPLHHRGRDDADQLIGGLGRVVEEQGVIRSLDSDREMIQAALVPPSNIVFRNVVAATENTLPDAGKIDIHAFRSDVNENDFKTEVSRSNHHFEIVSARKRSSIVKLSCLSRYLLASRRTPLPAAIGEAPEEANGRINLSGSSRGVREKVSGLPLVSVLFPAPFAPAMMVKTGGVTAQRGE